MALISLGESRWRMIRRVLKKKRFCYDEARNMTRHDQEQFEWMLENGFFVEVGDGWYSITDRARDAAELGFYEI
jgi:hypothetical protein